MSKDPSAVMMIHGLSEVDAQVRLKTEGYNELPRPDRRTPFRIAFEVLREPLLALLLGSGVIYLTLGDLKDALILLVFVIMSVVMTVVQETRIERVLEALRDLTSPRALAIRDGVRKRVAGRWVVRGYIVVLAEGDRVPADAVLVQARDLCTDESLLTGESLPVRKVAKVARRGGGQISSGARSRLTRARSASQPNDRADHVRRPCRGRTRYAEEVPDLLQMQEDQLLRIEEGRLSLTPESRPLVRVVASAFDTYLRDSTARHSAAV